MVEEFFNNTSTLIVEKLFEKQPPVEHEPGQNTQITTHLNFSGILGWTPLLRNHLEWPRLPRWTGFVADRFSHGKPGIQWRNGGAYFTN